MRLYFKAFASGSVLAFLLKAGLTDAAAAGITDAFNINFGTDNGGGCSYVGETLMNTVFKDCFDLAQKGIEVVSEYGTDPRAKRLLDAFFGSGADLLSDQLDQISNTFLAVRDWIQKPGAVNGGQSSAKPWLYCHHSWLQRKDMASEALDTNGKVIINEVTKQPVKMNEIPKYVAAYQEADDEVDGRVTPYFSYTHNDYLFDADYGANRGYCSARDHAAATAHVLPTTTVTLCPSSFGANNSPPRRTSYRGLHSASLQPHSRNSIVDGSIPKGSSALVGDVLGTSLTLFHELFHVVLGNDASYPIGRGEVYELSNLLSLPYNVALLNPETYSVVAAAWDYTVSLNNGVEFYPGYAVA